MNNDPTILDVLSYMFDYIFETSSTADGIDDIALKNHLTNAGFDEQGINKAFVWLDNIASLQEEERQGFTQINPESVRFYQEHEQERLSIKLRNFLHFLQDTGQINPRQREDIIEQMMGLDTNDLNLDDLKWVAVMVLGNDSDRTDNHHWLEAIVLDEHHPTIQ